MLKKPCIFCVSGVKNSGKTSLITKLVPALKKNAYRIGVIKHDGHDFEIDVENTDTHKYRQAGSDAVVIYSQKKFALIRPWETVKIELLLEFLQDVDLIIIEGLKNSSYPKIETVIEQSVCDERYLLAIATDGDFRHEKIKTVSRNDIDILADIIENEVMRKPK